MLNCRKAKEYFAEEKRKLKKQKSESNSVVVSVRGRGWVRSNNSLVELSLSNLLMCVHSK
jgi:hypothetical protein